MEQILLQNNRTGTTAHFFSTQIIDDGTFVLTPSYATFNGTSITSINYLSGDSVWELNNNGNRVPVATVLTGQSYSTTINYSLSIDEQNKIKESFYNRVVDREKSYVIFEEKEIDDLFIDIKIERSLASIDTLETKNRVENLFPSQQSQTGVVFGRLVARQQILALEPDSEGYHINSSGEVDGKLLIPLRNVPIGIFNPSDKFPTVFSKDENEDRIKLNLYNKSDSSESQKYFNDYSRLEDEKYLNDLNYFTNLENYPDEYKYITFTNENGEFIIPDVPVGQQTLMFEVDLLKQGLTKDEVALNFYPYTLEQSPNIDNVPHFFFRQLPIDVVPNWGDFQTGYTQVDVSVNLDLRKWATYYFAPGSYNNLRPFNYIDNISIQAGLKVEILDMTTINNGFSVKDRKILQLSQIIDPFQKDESQALYWNNEIQMQKKIVEFRDDLYHILKLPANMYDPNNYRTDNNGEPIINSYNKGVWLSGYQFKTWYLDQFDVYRVTGFDGVNDSFHIKKYNNKNGRNETGIDGNNIYSKNWSHLYPFKYTIPKKPKDKIPYSIYVPRPKFIDFPVYRDGDLVGNMQLTNNISGNGFGKTGINSNVDFDDENYASIISSGFCYKYEKGVWDGGERYSNGYRPGNPYGIKQFIFSEVLNGEKWQRVESGYGYFMKPNGWPRIIFTDDLCFLNSNDISSKDSGYGGSNGSIEVLPVDTKINYWENSNFSYINTSTITAQNLYLNYLNNGYNSLKISGIDIYRLIDTNSLIIKKSKIVDQWVTFYIDKIIFQRGVDYVYDLELISGVGEGGNMDRAIHFGDSKLYNKVKLKIDNNSENSTNVLIGNLNIEIAPGNSYIVKLNDIYPNTGELDYRNIIFKMKTNDTFRLDGKKVYYDTLNVNFSIVDLEIYDMDSLTKTGGPASAYQSNNGIITNCRTYRPNKEYEVFTYMKSKFDNSLGRDYWLEVEGSETERYVTRGMTFPLSTKIDSMAASPS